MRVFAAFAVPIIVVVVLRASGVADGVSVYNELFQTYITNSLKRLKFIDPKFNVTASLIRIYGGLPRPLSQVCADVVAVLFDIEEEPDDGQIYCNSTWDTVSCWPVTAVGSVAVIPCPDKLQGIDHSKNASRYCQLNGTWTSLSNYSQCLDDNATVPTGLGVLDTRTFAATLIYNVGFIVSTVALVISLVIFRYFRSLRCLRNLIHCHLMITFVLRHIVYVIISNSLPFMVNRREFSWLCKTIFVAYQYLICTNFSWMFVEGLYLHTIIVWAYYKDKIKFWQYLVVGWGVPVPFIFVWVGLKATMEDDSCWLPVKGTSYYFVLYFLVLFTLCVNVIFFVSILWILITKLRSSVTHESRQYRKAVKATVILLPLLGLTYILFITPPGSDPLSKIIFLYITAFLQSFQGLFVAVFYCFLNSEVRSAIRKKFSLLQDTKSLTTRYTPASMTCSVARPSVNDENYQLVSLRNGAARGAAANQWECNTVLEERLESVP